MCYLLLRYLPIYLPLLELLVYEPIREALATDTDSFQHTIATELVEYQLSVNNSWLLEFIRNDATNKVGGSVPEGGHEVTQRSFVQLGHCDKLASLLPLCVLLSTLVVTPESCDEGLRGLAEKFHYRMVEWILVLVEPTSDCVANLKFCLFNGDKYI